MFHHEIDERTDFLPDLATVVATEQVSDLRTAPLDDAFGRKVRRGGATRPLVAEQGVGIGGVERAANAAAGGTRGVECLDRALRDLAFEPRPGGSALTPYRSGIDPRLSRCLHERLSLCLRGLHDGLHPRGELLCAA